MLEIRLDFLAKAPDFQRLLATKPCPMVATARRREDGGRWTGTEEDRKMLLRQAIVAGFDWVDLEMDVAEEIARFRKVKRIVSYHNLEEVPEDLEKIYEKMCGQDADVVSAVALEPEGPLAIEDPRLSTTYAGDGRPLRVGLELWVSAGDDDDEEEQYPRRASGEALGVAATGRLGRFDVLAQFVRWDSRYGDGAGVYVLAQKS